MKSREEILSYLFALHRQGVIKYELSRMREACRRLGNPHERVPCIHVAGTNGKGTVCSIIDSVIRASGLRCGLFIKPHLVEFEERYLIDGRPTQAQLWLDIYREMEPRVADLGLSFFEISTLVAFELFRQAGVDWAVYETGMGGRLDATNVVSPRVSVITSINLDHREYLGDSIAAIAVEKLGIVKHGVPVVMLRPPQEDVLSLASHVCEKESAPLHLVDDSTARNPVKTARGHRFSYFGIEIDLPLIGAHQVSNALCAMKACELAGVGGPSALRTGVASVRIPARFQRVTIRGKTVIFDIAHNPQAGASLVESLRSDFGESPDVCVVAGLMADKDIATFLAPLNTIARSFVFTRPDTPRAIDASKLPALLGRTSVPVEIATRVSDAVEKAISGPHSVVCITGSFYTVGEAMKSLSITPYGPS